MDLIKNKYKRQSTRLQGYNYNKEGLYFVTIYTHKSEDLFCTIVDGKIFLNRFGKVVKKFWKKIPDRYPTTDIDQFIIMPNHFHGIIRIIDNNNVGAIHESPLQMVMEIRRKMLLPKIIGYFKMNTAKSINEFRNLNGTAVWQQNYWERIIRNEQELNRIRNYIIQNPLKRKGK